MGLSDNSPTTQDDDHSDVCSVDSVDASTDEERTVGDAEPTAVDELKALAEAETKRMNCCKAFLVLAILLTGGLVASGTYRFLVEDQEAQFESAFSLHSGIIRDITKVRVASLVTGLTDFSEEITAHVKANNKTFPFVTIPFYEVKAGHVRRRAGIEIITVMPLVRAGERGRWEKFSVENQKWIEEGRRVVSGVDASEIQDTKNASGIKDAGEQVSIRGFISDIDPITGEFVPSGEKDVYAPIWQTSPPEYKPIYTNLDIFIAPEYETLYQVMTERNAPIFGTVSDMTSLAGTSFSNEDHKQYHAQWVNVQNGTHGFEHPHAKVLVPIYRNLSTQGISEIEAMLSAVVPLDRFTEKLLPDGAPTIYMVLENSCNQSYTFRLSGNSGNEYLGEGDRHNRKYTDWAVTINFDSEPWTDTSSRGFCRYRAVVYPSEAYQDDLADSMPALSAILVSCLFVGLIVSFGVYDAFVSRRNSKVMAAAAKTSRIVMSLFPSNVRKQLLGKPEQILPTKQPTPDADGKYRVRNMLHEAFTSNSNKPADPNDFLSSKPIAELFPECTVMFGDIAGFTAWSSVREPAQVFILLENIYRRLDEIAKRKRVFKVETVGDCYVAVCGLPDPRKDHAVVMARFARDCMSSMSDVVKKLEVELGPDTGDLAMRIGLHSGPVTAGVLRGERARFQLFGDTVNTASRMESTGMKDKIHLSTETADQLIGFGKDSWVTKREDRVVAKGKGTMETWWLSMPDKKGDDTSSLESNSAHYMSDDDMDAEEVTPEDRKIMLLSAPKAGSMIRWNTEVLARLLKKIIVNRAQTQKIPANMQSKPVVYQTSNKRPMDEIVEVISLPQDSSNGEILDESKVILSEDVTFQLRDLVASIAALYHDNPFHSFEHASHVTMSVNKLMSRIVAPSDIDRGADEGNNKEFILHDHTYGITSDPLTQFACVFSALIHDVDHHGVPNTQLMKEETGSAKYYEKSIAEQNSIDLAWNLIMQDCYKDLRAAIYINSAELNRFRQLVVNSVIATDIMDKDLKNLRNARWDKAFAETSEASATGESLIMKRNRKATIVIEHLIQASDVAHTMQHWHVYRKWNERLYKEMVKAYKAGRAEKHPAEFWYEGEIGFFDFYIIPLAKKLKNCGVFGVASDEYLNYALKNRAEWQDKGREIVAEMQNEEGSSSNLRSSSLI